MTDPHMKRNLSTSESRKFWRFIDKTAAIVEKWPMWMRGESLPRTKAESSD